MNTITNGDCVALMRELPSDSLDAIVTDPPYALTDKRDPRRGSPSSNQRQKIGGFMGMRWDVPDVAFDPATWAHALRIAKPGAHLLAFGGTRTFHRLACAIEDAGWEIRDCLMWLYGSGFPKSHNLDGEFEGCGTALKPAWEPIIMARKSLEGTVLTNMQAYGTGALNIDAGRIETGECLNGGTYTGSRTTGVGQSAGMPNGIAREFVQPAGRWPANICLDETAAEQLDQMSGISGASPLRTGRKGGNNGALGAFAGSSSDAIGVWPADPGGGASRFYYCAKVSTAERNAGCDALPLRHGADTMAGDADGSLLTGAGNPRDTTARNHHPTVKPISLMRWLCRLVIPRGGVVLDPFCGSGSTCVAAALEGFDYLGFDMDADYCNIARARIAYWIANPPTDARISAPMPPPTPGGLFDFD